MMKRRTLERILRNKLLRLLIRQEIAVRLVNRNPVLLRQHRQPLIPRHLILLRYLRADRDHQDGMILLGSADLEEAESLIAECTRERYEAMLPAVLDNSTLPNVSASPSRLHSRASSSRKRCSAHITLSEDTAVKYGMLTESRTIVPKDYEVFHRNRGLEKDFRYIFTYDKIGLQRMPLSIIYFWHCAVNIVLSLNLNPIFSKS